MKQEKTNDTENNLLFIAILNNNVVTELNITNEMIQSERFDINNAINYFIKNSINKINSK